jgi:sarcosine oxidase subunit alpha
MRLRDLKLLLRTMSEPIQVSVNGSPVMVAPGTVVAAAIMLTGHSHFRRSPLGDRRGPLCGMGICMECRATIDGREQCRSCLIVCSPGMEIRTDA